jgi:polar amino acid transport system substrate-binding protein
VQTQGKVEQLGEVSDAAPQGIAVSKDDPELTAALQAAMQHLIDEGVWQDILDTWGVAGAVETAELNPAV